MDIDISVLNRIYENFISENKIYFFEDTEIDGCIPQHPHICVKVKDQVLVLSTISSQVLTTRAKLIEFGVATESEMPVIAPSGQNKLDKQSYVECDQAFICDKDVFAEQQSKRLIWDTGGELAKEDLQAVISGILTSDKVAEEIKNLFK